MFIQTVMSAEGDGPEKDLDPIFVLVSFANSLDVGLNVSFNTAPPPPRKGSDQFNSHPSPFSFCLLLGS